MMMAEEISLKLGADPEPLGCQVGGCGGLTIDERAGGLVYEAWGREGPV
jgi:hypothetical protein